MGKKASAKQDYSRSNSGQQNLGQVHFGAKKQPSARRAGETKPYRI